MPSTNTRQHFNGAVKQMKRESGRQKQLDEANKDQDMMQLPDRKQRPSAASLAVQRAFRRLNREHRDLKSKLNSKLQVGKQSWDHMEYAERQNSVGTLELFKYAHPLERLAIGLGILFMCYAASWQPISVFILAIMASLMGQYSKQVSWLQQLQNGGANNNHTTSSSSLAHFGLPASPQMSANLSSKLIPSAAVAPTSVASYEGYAFLAPLYSFVTPIFDLGSSSASKLEDDDSIRAAIHDILNHESNQFLRKSFEINGSAFALALTQLLAFFFGMTLITQAAKQQAARVKILYFRSCLHQEVTWFEAIDSASGSGSSLNALVDRYEDGIGMKLALLCYFIGHIGLFALTAFYQMFNLAAFCMPFVLLVGFIIAYLSEWQAVAIGQHALFAKRSLQLAEEILAAIRTVFAFNGQQKEITRFSMSLQPVYRKSLIKHLYTALNTSLSKFSIFACFSCYCFYAMHLFPPFNGKENIMMIDKATILAVLRGAEVSIVNILISIPFMEALQQSKGSIARIYATIERRSKIDPANERGAKPAGKKGASALPISFRMVQFGYADRSGPTRRRSTLPFLNLVGSPGSGGAQATVQQQQSQLANQKVEPKVNFGEPNSGERRRSLIDEFADCDLKSSRPSVSAVKRGEIVLSQTGNSKRILNYFNLEIKAGQSVALVGPSGSGKSTVLALVQRLYDITGGQLLIGQHSIKDLNVAWLRQQIALVAQEPRLFDMSIADNIRLGLSEEHEKELDSANGRSSASSEEEREKRIMQQVIEASKAAGAHEFISRLPNGYSTQVGSGGVQLSGGQKQRIAIARALIRRPKILLLDESTSALDTESEAQVQEALRRASAGRTTLTVAHRLSTIKHVDLIVVMHQGQVLECGSHEELMERERGVYRQMYEDQVKSVTESSSPQLEGIVEADEGDGRASRQSAKKSTKQATSPPSKLSELSAEKLASDSKSKSQSPLSRVEFEMDENREDALAEDEEEDDDDDESYDGTNSTSGADERVSPYQLWQFIEMPKWSSLAAAIVCLLSGLILPLNLIAHSYLFSVFAYSEPEQIGDYLHVFGLLMLSFSTFVFVVSFLQIILPGYVGEKLSSRLRVKTMDSLLSKPMFYFDMSSNSAGSLCDRFNHYISSIQSLAGARIAIMLDACSTLLAGAFFGFGQNLQLSLFCLSFALLVLLTTIIESRIVQRESSLEQKFDAQLAHLMADALSNIKTIASLNREAFFIDRFSEIIRQRKVGSGQLTVWLRTFLTSLKFVMPAMSWSAAMYFGCHLLVDGRIELQTIFIVCPVVLFAVNDTFRALVFLPELLKARKSVECLYKLNRDFSPQILERLSLAQQLEQQSRLHLAQQDAEAALKCSSSSDTILTSCKAPNSGDRDKDDDMDFLGVILDPDNELVRREARKKSISFALDQVEEEPSARQPLDRRTSNLAALPTYMRRKSSRLNSLVPCSPARGSIEFKSVDFAYPNRPSALVLDQFSLSIAPGESVALVGSSGSGKSTCVAILEKFYDYHAGRVSLDGRDLRLMESQWVRSQIGLVSQEPTLLSYSIGDNIRYGDNGRFVSMEEVVEAARTANIHDFIMSLPDQYDTELSSSAYSSGSQLSGGQRQRIAIARALIRNAPILIFDEATSALDSRNECLVQDALNKARRGRTNLTIAHRLASIKDADKIAVLHEGKLVEVGRHEELLAKANGHYKALWEHQEGSSFSSQ